MGIGLFVVAREFAANPAKWGITDQEAVLSYLNLVRQIRKTQAVVAWPRDLQIVVWVFGYVLFVACFL